MAGPVCCRQALGKLGCSFLVQYSVSWKLSTKKGLFLVRGQNSSLADIWPNFPENHQLKPLGYDILLLNLLGAQGVLQEQLRAWSLFYMIVLCGIYLCSWSVKKTDCSRNT